MRNLGGRRESSALRVSLVAIGSLAIATMTFGAEMGLGWNRSNINTLRALDKSAVAELVNDLRDASGPVPRPGVGEIGQFAWAAWRVTEPTSSCSPRT
jgi:hypothetical protein